MREFFRPWRRKIGVCTLVMACMFAGGWVRSFCIADTFFVFYKSETPKKDRPLRGVVIADTLMVFPQQTPLVLRSCSGRLEIWYNRISAGDDLSLESKKESEIEPTVRRTKVLRIVGPSISTGSSVSILATVNMGGDPVVNPGFRWITPQAQLGIPDVFNYLPKSINWQLSGFVYGFETIEFDFLQGNEKLRMEAWGVPYWFIILSITALSALLLLTKPRQSTQKKTALPVQDEGGGVAT